MFYNAKWYDLYLNHFTQPDSIVPTSAHGVQAWDRYAYASNNPVRYNDPTGHCPICLIGAGIGALVGGVAYGAYAAYTGNFNGWHLAAAIGGGVLAGALIGSAVRAPESPEVVAATVAMVTGGGTTLLQATSGDPSDEISTLSQAAQEAAPNLENAVTQVGDDVTSSAQQTSDKIQQVANDIEDWLGNIEKQTTRNPNGDFVLRNAENTARFRFDFFKTYSHLSPHLYLEWLEDGEWIKPGPIYPNDVPPE
jgi:hypothetical protein